MKTPASPLPISPRRVSRLRISPRRVSPPSVSPLRSILEFLLPGACLGCRDRIAVDRWTDRICSRCRTRLRPPPAPRCRRCGMPRGTGAASGERERGTCEECRGWPPVLEAARSAVVLGPPADALVHALKYGGWKEVAGPMGRRMARAFLEDAPADVPEAVRKDIPRAARKEVPEDASPIVVPVPTTRTRERRRGYNQAELLAEVIADALQFPLIRALRRRSGGRTQVFLHPLQRVDNVRHAFSYRAETAAHIRGRRALLVDDVLTTGATAVAASGALESGGVSGVFLLTFARALPFQSSS